MPTKKRITPAERRHQDYLRRKTLRVASVYETRLAKDRRKELRRVLDMARDYNDPIALIPLIQGQIDETPYLVKWWQGLTVDAGLPIAKATARDLRAMKAAGEEDVWLTGLRNYATQRAGQEIVIVSGTWKDSLVKITRTLMEEDLGIGIEKLTKRIYNRYVGDLEKWQVRRIAQTEAMIGMAEAANDAAKTLSIHYTKEWCISGLGNTRESHEAMDGVTVDEDEPFVLPGGTMMYPHDTSMNAAAGEIINCACTCIRRPKTGTGQTAEPEPAQTSPSPQAEPVQPEQQATDAAREKRIQEIMAEMDQSLPEETRRAIAENDLELENALGVKKGKPMTVDKADEQSANPKFKDQFILDPNGPYFNRSTGERFSLNPDYTSQNKRYHINCTTCTPAFHLRERGFDITAKGRVKGSKTLVLNDKAARDWAGMWKNVDGTKATIDTFDSWMRKKGYYSMTEKRYQEFFDEMCPKDGTYAIGVSWQGGGGHATILRRENGKLSYIEPQRYDKKKGVRRGVDEICKRVSSSPRSSDGILYLDDKLFDTSWAGLFNK